MRDEIGDVVSRVRTDRRYREARQFAGRFLLLYAILIPTTTLGFIVGTGWYFNAIVSGFLIAVFVAWKVVWLPALLLAAGWQYDLLGGGRRLARSVGDRA